jgi:hypothetical protein
MKNKPTNFHPLFVARRTGVPPPTPPPTPTKQITQKLRTFSMPNEAMTELDKQGWKLQAWHAHK